MALVIAWEPQESAQNAVAQGLLTGAHFRFEVVL